MLIVVELGSQWPSWLNNQAEPVLRRVLSQTEEETSPEFAGRIAETARAGGLTLHGAVLLCNDRTDPLQMRERKVAASALVGALAPGRSNHLVISASEGASESLKVALAALATELNGARGAQSRGTVAVASSEAFGMA